MLLTLRKRSVFFALSTWLLALAPAAFAETPFDGHWQGAIAVPGTPLEIDVDFSSDAEGTIEGDISIPVQGIRDMSLSGIAAEGESLHFQIPGIPGDPTFNGKLSSEGSTLSGSFAQGGAQLTFSLEREDAGAKADSALEGFGAVAEKAVADFNVPGLGIAIVHGGEVVYAEGFGFRDLEKKLPMTADSLFAIGSTTKAMTATVLAMQVEEGLFEWDEPLTRYLPGFRLSDPMITARITPRDLVTHRSGLPRHDLLWYNVRSNDRAALIKRFEYLELTADLRERFQYNNLMFMTAGYLAGQLDGRTWEESVKARLFDPLGMKRSNFSVTLSEADPDHAWPYRENDDEKLERIPFRNIDLIGPAGAVNSSVREMATWLLFNLAGGVVPGGTRLLQNATLADLHQPHMTLDSPPSPEARISQADYGMGWMVEVYRGHRRVEHGGGIDGFITSVAFYPDDDLGIVTFTNRGSGLPSLISQVAADRLLGLEPVDWLGDALTRLTAAKAQAKDAEAKLEATRVEGTKPSHALADYAGDYEDQGYGVVTVELRRDALWFTFNDIATPLVHWHYDVWNALESEDDPTFKGSKLQFRADLEGEIVELVMPLETFASPIVFKKKADAKLSDPAYLRRYVGSYQGPTGQRAGIELSGEGLTLHLLGQPVYVLVPEVSGRFSIEGLQGFSVGFELDAEGRAVKAIFYQPNGVFESERIED